MPAEISELIADLSSPRPEVRARAAEQLSRAGEDAKAAAVPLVRAARDDSEEVREWATSALEELGAPSRDDLPALANLLEDQNADVGYWAATLLGRLEDKAAAAAANLAAVVSGSEDIAVRQRAAWALGKIGPGAAVALDALRQAADSDDARLARLARQAIAAIEP